VDYAKKLFDKLVNGFGKARFAGGSSSGITCHWTGAGTDNQGVATPPTGAVTNQDRTAIRYTYISKGPGPGHSMLANRGNTDLGGVNCFADQFIDTFSFNGDITQDIGFHCQDAAGQKIDVPEKCNPQILWSGQYEGAAHIDVGSDNCFGESLIPGAHEPEISMTVTEDAEFSVGGISQFAKSGQIARGNKLVHTTGTEIGASAGTGKDGFAGDVSVKFSRTTSEEQSYEPANVQVIGGASSPSPLVMNKAMPLIELKLRSSSTIAFRGISRAWGNALSKSVKFGLWWYAKAAGECGSNPDALSWVLWGVDDATRDGIVPTMKSWYSAQGVTFNDQMQRTK